MSTSTTTTSGRRQRRGFPLPPWILLNNEGYLGNGGYLGSRSNAITAVGEGRNNLTVEVPFRPAKPPLPSILSVFCPGIKYPRRPLILSAAEDLLVFRLPVAAGPSPRCATPEECDYFVYRAGSPSLTLIPNPKHCFFNNADVGILPRRGGLFTIAALVPCSTKNEYMLHRFDSEAGSWVLKTVYLDAPRTAFPVKIPVKTGRLNHHINTTVIILGGEDGTMAWVDLWSGILIYDLNREDQDKDRPSVRHIPLPVPMHAITCNYGMGAKLGCPRSRRGIAVVTKRGKSCIKLADLQIFGGRLPYDDIETQMHAFLVDDWIVTTWSNTNMGSSFEDWHEDYTICGSKIKISDAVRAKLLSSGLLNRKPSQDNGEEVSVEIALQNLAVSEPTPSLDGDEDVLFLMARTKLFHPRAFALAIDMRNSTLLDVAEFGIDSGPGISVTYRPSIISKYMKLVSAPGNCYVVVANA